MDVIQLPRQGGPNLTVWLYAIISVLIISAVSLIGVVTLGMGGEKLRKITLFLVSFAVGGLFGDALIHLLPETFKDNQSPLSLFPLHHHRYLDILRAGEVSSLASLSSTRT